MKTTDLSPAWLARALGVEPGAVTGLQWEPLGAGQVADTFRLSFEIDHGDPQHLVLKMTSKDEASSATGRRELNYLREVRYYQELAATLDVRVPRCVHAEISNDGQDFALLLEDLTPCRAGDQLRDCNLDEARLVVDEAAKIHGPRWADPQLENARWMPSVRVASSAEVAYWPTVMGRFRERYGDLVEDEILSVGDELWANMATYMELQRQVPWTVQHGDFRSDNLLFDAHRGRVPVAVVDWQTVQRGPGVLDVSYFLGGALPPRLRREHEFELVTRYHRGLKSQGVENYSFDECWRDYARFAFQGYFVGVGAALAVKRTARGDQVFVSMVRRAGRHVLDLDALTHLRVPV